MESLLPLFCIGVPLFFVGVVAMIVYAFYSSGTKARKRGVAVESALDQMRRQLVVVTGSTVPGSQITRVIGLVRGVSDTQATSKDEFALAEKEALFNMLSEAKRLGASAVIETRLNTGTYQQQGSQWQVSQAVYSGTAVEIREACASHDTPAEGPASGASP